MDFLIAADPENRCGSGLVNERRIKPWEIGLSGNPKLVALFRY